MNERYTITVKALKDDKPPAVRLERLLKYALRACRLRCVEVSQERKTQEET